MCSDACGYIDNLFTLYISFLSNISQCIFLLLIVILLFIFLICIQSSRLLKSKWFRSPLYIFFEHYSYSWKDVSEIIEKEQLQKSRIPYRVTIFIAIFIFDIIMIILFTTIFIYIALILNFFNLLISILIWINIDTTMGTFILATFLTLVGIYYQIQAQVRSKNRQKWINKVRNNLAIIINYIGEKNQYLQQVEPRLYRIDITTIKPIPGNNIKSIPYLYPEANLARLNLELLINPSEKDHRTLSTLLRRACGIDEIEIDKIVIEHIPNLAKRDDYKSLITQIIRLSNAMLKREWELVKYGR